MLSTSCYGILKIIYLMEFSTDWVSKLMPSDKRNSITAKATGLIFSLFDVASARQVPFGIPQYIQCILHGLNSVPLCIPFIFADSEKCRFGDSTWWLPFVTEIVHICHSGYFDIRGAFQTVLDSSVAPIIGSVIRKTIYRLCFSYIGIGSAPQWKQQQIQIYVFV